MKEIMSENNNSEQVSRRSFLTRIFGRDKAETPKEVVPVTGAPERSHKNKGSISRRNALKMFGVVGTAAIVANAMPEAVVNAAGMLSGGTNEITDPVGSLENGNGFPPKGHPVTEGENNDSHEKLQASIIIMGVSSATLTDTEKKNRDALFATDKSNYAGLIKDLKIDSGKFINLPFEAGSDADKNAQALAPLAASMQNAGVKPELILAEDEDKGIVATTLTFSNTDKDFNLGKSVFKPGTGFEVYNGQIHYFQLTKLKDGGEMDKIMTIPVTKDLRDYISQFYFEGQQLEVAKDAQYLMAQVSPDGTISGLISEDRPYFFKPLAEEGQPTATPESPNAKLPPPQTAVPEEILAKVVSESAAEFDARMKEKYKELWIDKDAKVKYVDSSHFSINNSQPYKIEAAPNIVLSKFDGIESTDKSETSVEHYATGTFVGITGTNVVDDINIQTSDGKYKLEVQGVKVIELAMLIKVKGKDFIVKFSIPENLVFQTDSAGGKFTDIDSILGKMSRGRKIGVTFPRGKSSQQDWINESFKIRNGRVPDVFSAYEDSYNKALALICSTTQEQIVALNDLSKGTSKGGHLIDVGSPWEIVTY